MSMGSELLARLYDCCPMGAKMGGELLSMLLSNTGAQIVFIFVQERKNNISCCLWGHKLCSAYSFMQGENYYQLLPTRGTNCVYFHPQGGELLSVAV